VGVVTVTYLIALLALATPPFISLLEQSGISGERRVQTSC